MINLIKRVFVLIVFIGTIWIGSFLHPILDFTVGNTLRGIYATYSYSGKAIDGVKNIAGSTKDSVKGILKMEVDKQDALDREESKEDNEKNEKMAKILIDAIPILLTIWAMYYIFNLILNPFVSDKSLTKDVLSWINFN